ncbi:MAG: DNA recombination protein RmuC [Caldimicrobium sp.]|nr:DNA recombination protein RmuC [Caldimicrobium sp.]MCX7613461.1 DNA recombination protein RmuC [Caldimicrobium sp.]MDW8182967.1 DNA recombination protein RmuC [Caldimicrobium sp.]
MTEALGFIILSIVLIFGLLLLYFQLRSYLEKRLTENLFSIKERLQDLSEIRRDLQKLYFTEEILKTLREELSKLSQIFISRRSGKAGERVLEEVLSQLPTHLLKRDLKLSTGEVEFALALDEGRYLPIDSKFVAPEILAKDELTPEEEKDLLRRVKNRAREILPYLRDERTVGMAIMTCPDGLFPYLQRRIFEELERDRILLVPYSFLLPVTLFIHYFWERFGKPLDRDNIIQGVSNIERFAFEIERDIEKTLKELKSAENLLLKLRESYRALQRELNSLKESSYKESNSMGTLE